MTRTGEHEGGAFAASYAASLADFIRDGSEDALARAYDLGREASGQGIGVIELSLLHHAVLRELVAPRAADASVQLDAAAQFLAEALSPFEMTHRGFAEANRELRRKNTELKEANARAEAANRELEAFSFSVSHDLRSPLRAIDGFSRVLADDYVDALDERGRNYLARVRAAAGRMGELIDDLLELSRVARQELRRDRVDLTALARKVLDEIARADPSRRVDVDVEPELEARADERLVRVLLENLLGNAWKFTSKTAAARIEVGVDPDGTFYVRDNGAGFDMQFAGRLFAPFQRLHADSDFPGTGIGLATVRRIVERHGGKVWAEAAVGKGATVHFTLPPA